jgi:type I restriction enzyme M protein
MNHGEIVGFLWGVADLIRDTFRRGKYQDVILPLTVLRRLDCVLAATKEAVLARQAALKDRGLENLDQQLRLSAGFAFYTPRAMISTSCSATRRISPPICATTSPASARTCAR